MSEYAKIESGGSWVIQERPRWLDDNGDPVTDARLAEDGYYPVVRNYPPHDSTVNLVQEPQSNWGVVEGQLIINYTTTPVEPEVLEQQAVREAKSVADALVRKSVVDSLLDTVTNEELSKLTYLYDEWSGAGIVLEADDKVRRNGILYRVVIGHTTQPDWTPESESALFAKFRDPAAGPQPWTVAGGNGTSGSYLLGTQVTHDNPNDGGNIWIYQSAINANTTEPGRDSTFDRWWTPISAV